MPPLRPPNPNATSSEVFDGPEGDSLFDALCDLPVARTIRTKLAGAPATLNALQRDTGLDVRRTTALLEKASNARLGDDVFLPLRVHLFHRAQGGLWACTNPSCPGRDARSLGGTWGLGALHTARRSACRHCRYPVFELVSCGECGQEYLSAEETFCGETGEQKLIPSLNEDDVDEFELDIDPDIESEEDAPVSNVGRRLICGDPDLVDVDQWCLDETNTLSKDGDGVPVRLSPLDDGPLACLRCGAKDHRRLFRELRTGAPFALSTIIPTALEHTPPMDAGAGLPSGGRRLLGFTDSRQGSARLAVRLQQEAERNRVRSILCHALAAERKTVDTVEIEQQIAKLRETDSPVLRPILESKERELAEACAAGGVGTLSWDEAIQRLLGDASLRRMHREFRRVADSATSEEDFANFCLYREFFRRPKRMNSTETMGLVSLRYPVLERQEPPAGWPLRADDWVCFLKLVVDFFLRDASAVDVADDYLRWMGIPVRKRYVQGPGHMGTLTSRQRAWPSWQPRRRPSRLPVLLQQAAELDGSLSSIDRVNDVLGFAWTALKPYMQQLGDGYLLRLREVAELSELSVGQVCPYTGRVVDTTLRGLSPYLTSNGQAEPCQQFAPPRLPKPYWRDESGATANRAEVVDWLENDRDVAKARNLGVWSNLNDRIVANAPYYETAEHSAQLDSPRLRELEDRFKAGEVNVLSCSTTMEMGVDIGGLSAVVMNNAPPSSANYRQRAGRAGRRGEGVSFAVTLCPNSPHGEQVFNNPLWPFTSPIAVPRVALDSARLVQRHVNSLCLGTFLEGRDARRLRTGWFFQRGESGDIPGEQFTDWCCGAAESNQRLVQGIRHLVRGTVLQSVSPSALLSGSANALQKSVAGWRREVDALRADAAEFDDSESKTPAVLAIERQLQRLEGEYLLSELANRQFLPGYGFPNGIVSFNPLTVAELRKRQNRNLREDRDDARGKRLGYPSRHLEMAIREYAPGAEVTIDGRVYESGGVILNWHIPPDVENVNEVQALRYAWRCRACNATGDEPRSLDQCPHCHGAVEERKFLEPAGFAVDIRHSPHNNVVAPTYIPVEAPWISCPTPEWSPLKDPIPGRYRYSDAGHLFHGSRGAHGFGYAICLRCGRAASEVAPSSTAVTPKALGPGHPRLRGGKNWDGSSECDGEGFAIQRGLSLGGSQTTDVFELQLAQLDDPTTALSLGIALRCAFCRLLGVQDEEVGVTVRQGIGADGDVVRSIFLYDTATGGNGYVAALRDDVAKSLRQSVNVLECAQKCDAACHACLLTYGTQYDAARLDRHSALAFMGRGGYET